MEEQVGEWRLKYFTRDRSRWVSGDLKDESHIKDVFGGNFSECFRPPREHNI